MRATPGLVALVIGSIGLGACGGSEPELSSRSFSVTAVAVAKGANPPSRMNDREVIEVEFSESEGWVGWSAGCNFYGADATITDSQVKVDNEVTRTELACEFGTPAEEWFENFLREYPKWQLSESMLTLSSDRAVVELRASD